MNQIAVETGSTSLSVLNIEIAEVPQFVRKCIEDRVLSGLISNLNKDLLQGTPTERQNARLALSHLGFL